MGAGTRQAGGSQPGLQTTHTSFSLFLFFSQSPLSGDVYPVPVHPFSSAGSGEAFKAKGLVSASVWARLEG